jgi:hypothetical protein
MPTVICSLETLPGLCLSMTVSAIYCYYNMLATDASAFVSLVRYACYYARLHNRLLVFASCEDSLPHAPSVKLSMSLTRRLPNPNPEPLEMNT